MERTPPGRFDKTPRNVLWHPNPVIHDASITLNLIADPKRYQISPLWYEVHVRVVTAVLRASVYATI